MSDHPSNEVCGLCRTMVNQEGLAHLIEIGYRHNLASEFMVILCDVVADLAQCRHEGRSYPLALVVGDKERCHKVLPPSLFSLPADLTIQEFQNRLQDFAGLLDGRHVILAVDRTGRLLGVRRVVATILGPGYQEMHQSVNPIYTGIYRHLATISQLTQGLVFYVAPPGNLVKVFDQGTIVALYTRGDWCAAQYEVFLQTMVQTADQLLSEAMLMAPEVAGHFRTYLIKAARVAFLMSARGEGTILSLDLDLKPAHRRTTRLSGLLALQEKGWSITDLEDEELANLAALDGAVLIDGRGRILEFNAILSPSRVMEGESHYGARHDTAINYSVERKWAIILVVSEDGSLSAFCRGQKIGAVRVN